MTGTVPDVQSEATRINPEMNPVLSVPEIEAPPTPEVLPTATVVSTLFNARNLHKRVLQLVNGYSCAMKCYSYYRPQRSCRKVMFLHLSVILSTGVGGLPYPPGRHPTGQTLEADTPQGRHPSLGRYPLDRHPPSADTPTEQTSPGDTPWADIPPQETPLLEFLSSSPIPIPIA